VKQLLNYQDRCLRDGYQYVNATSTMQN
jgi:hypothetical protein